MMLTFRDGSKAVPELFPRFGIHASQVAIQLKYQPLVMSQRDLPPDTSAIYGKSREPA